MNELAFGNEMGGSLGLGYSVSSVVVVELLSGFTAKKIKILITGTCIKNLNCTFQYFGDKKGNYR